MKRLPLFSGAKILTIASKIRTITGFAKNFALKQLRNIRAQNIVTQFVLEDLIELNYWNLPMQLVATVKPFTHPSF